jgi:hypothetical protein
MSDTQEHHETRRKPKEIVDRAKRWQDMSFSWKNILAVISTVIVIGLVFVAWSFIAPSSNPSNPPPTSGNGIQSLGAILLTIFVVALLVLAFLRMQPAATTATAFAWRPSIPSWLIPLLLIAIVAVFHDSLMALFPFDTQVRLRTAENVLMDNILWTGLALTVLLLLLGQRSAAAVAGIAVVLAFFLMPDAQGFSRSDRLHAWWNAPPKRTVTAYSNPEVFRDAVAKELGNEKCPGKMVVLDRSNPFRLVPGPQCLFHFKVITGTFQVTGTDGYGRTAKPLMLSPQGAAVADDPQFYARGVRLVSTDGEMQVLECPTGSVIRHWKCWDR